jgi:hypothetical protein
MVLRNELGLHVNNSIQRRQPTPVEEMVVSSKCKQQAKAEKKRDGEGELNEGRLERWGKECVERRALSVVDASPWGKKMGQWMGIPVSYIQKELTRAGGYYPI